MHRYKIIGRPVNAGDLRRVPKMLDINSVSLTGRCVRAYKYVGKGFDALTLTVVVENPDGPESTFKIKSSGDKSRFFSEDEYKGVCIRVEDGTLELDSYESKKTGKTVSEFIIKASPGKIDILASSPDKAIRFGKVEGKVTQIDGDFVLVKTPYSYTNKQTNERVYKDRTVRVKVTDTSPITIGHNWMFFGTLQNDAYGVYLQSGWQANTYSKMIPKG